MAGAGACRVTDRATIVSRARRQEGAASKSHLPVESAFATREEVWQWARCKRKLKGASARNDALVSLASSSFQPPGTCFPICSYSLFLYSHCLLLEFV